MVAARLVLDRVYPARKGSPVTLPLPAIKGAADVSTALSAVTAASASGEDPLPLLQAPPIRR